MWREREIGIVSFERCCKSRASGNRSWEINAALIPGGVFWMFLVHSGAEQVLERRASELVSGTEVDGMFRGIFSQPSGEGQG